MISLCYGMLYVDARNGRNIQLILNSVKNSGIDHIGTAPMLGQLGCKWACTSVDGPSCMGMHTVMWASQKDLKVQRMHWTRAHPHKGLQTQWSASEYLKMAAQSIKSNLPGTTLCKTVYGWAKKAQNPNGHPDACTHMQRATKDLRKPTDKQECVRIPQNGCIRPNLPPGRTLNLSPEKVQRPRKDMDALSGCMHMHSTQIDIITTAKIAEVVSIPIK